MGDAGWRDDRDAAWPSGQKRATSGDNLIDVEIIWRSTRWRNRDRLSMARPRLAPGWTEHRRARYATARSVLLRRGPIALASAVKRPPRAG